MKAPLILVTAALALLARAAETVPTPQPTHPPPTPLIGPRPAPAAVPPFTSPAAMQAEFIRRFEMSPGFGLSRVVLPTFLAPTPALVWNGATYQVSPPELVGLEDVPVVYAPRAHHAFPTAMTNSVTRKELRRLFRPRPLTAQETNAVAALRAGRDLLVMTNHPARPESELELLTPPGLRVFGALRAGKSCAECHQCAQGVLLGTFAYQLTPVTVPGEAGPNSSAARLNRGARPGDPAADSPVPASFHLPPIHRPRALVACGHYASR